MHQKRYHDQEYSTYVVRLPRNTDRTPKLISWISLVIASVKTAYNIENRKHDIGVVHE